MEYTELNLRFDSFVQMKEFKESIGIDMELEEFRNLKLSDNPILLKIPEFQIGCMNFEILEIREEISICFNYITLIVAQKGVSE